MKCWRSPKLVSLVRFLLRTTMSFRLREGVEAVVVRLPVMHAAAATALRVAALAAIAAAVTVSQAAAQTGCPGQAGAGSSGESAELTARLQAETVEKAKAIAGIGIIPLEAGVGASASHLKHDGFRLRTPQSQSDCAPVPPLAQTVPFRTDTFSVGGIGEADLTRSLGLTGNQTFRMGAAVNWKSLDTKTADIVTALPFNTGAAHIREDGVQVDLYALATWGTTYGLLAGSLGRGDSELTNTSTSLLAPTRVVLGSGNTNYHDRAISGTVGHVFTLSQSTEGNVLADFSVGLAYTSFTRNGFIDTVGATFSDTNVNEFAGKIEVKLAYQMMQGMTVVTPYVKTGIKQRFSYDNTLSVRDNLVPGGAAVPPVTINYDLQSDDTFWRVGGGLAASFNGGAQTGVVELMYQRSGDSNELIAKGQLLIKLQ